MIVRTDLSPPLLITQPDHATLAAAIMEPWVAGGLRESPRLPAIRLAIQAHDNGWQEVDEAPFLEPGSGAVLDFVHVPESVRHEVWRRGVARLGGEPYAAALVAQHALHVYRRMRQQEGWRSFFSELTSARDWHLHAAHERIDTLQHEYTFLRLADLASLTFCGVDTAGQSHEMGYDLRFDGTHLIVTPDPFAGASMALEITGHELASLSFASAADARAAWDVARNRTLTGLVSGA